MSLRSGAGRALRRVAGRGGASEAIAHDIEQTARLVAEMNHAIVQLAEAVRVQGARLDELHHLVTHLDGRFEQTRDHVEIISALTLALQRQAERQGLLPEDTTPRV